MGSELLSNPVEILGGIPRYLSRHFDRPLAQHAGDVARGASWAMIHSHAHSETSLGSYPTSRLWKAATAMARMAMVNSSAYAVV